MENYSRDDLLARGISEEGIDILMHIGMPRRSGRYPWGSGENPYQHMPNYDFLKVREKMRKEEGMSDREIAVKMGLSNNKYWGKVNLAREQQREDNTKTIQAMAKRGQSVKEMMEKTGWSESSVRKAMKADTATETNKRRQTKDVAAELEGSLERVGGYLDVGKGVEVQLGIPKDKKNNAVQMLVDSGKYELHNIQIGQVTNPSGIAKTTVSVLVKKGTTIQDVYNNIDKIKPVDFYSESGSSTAIQRIREPKSIDSSRVKIRYAIPEGEKGHGTIDDGQTMDGSMFIRPGVKDLDMGDAKYAQVRIAVDGKYYLKGMALYGDEKDFPDGADIIFNTNKTKDKPLEKVLKPMYVDPKTGKHDPDNPFSATIKRQAPLKDKYGKPVIDEEATAAEEKRIGHKLKTPIYKNGAINIVNEEGDWQSWSKGLSSQFLAKQPEAVVKERLTATTKQFKNDLDEIAAVTNPVAKRKLLDSYISNVEAREVNLKAAAPRGFQGHVLLPVPTMKENEVYAPNYENGTKVILIRYPHAGRFEIPELIVNNNGPGKKIIGPQSKDAIGIHPKVASKMSGADFDGDAAYLIPNNHGKYKSEKSLKGLQGFDPGIYEDDPKTFKLHSKKYYNTQMGIVSNLITDMTLSGKATEDELERAVKHSMVTIDAYKHKLNYKRSYDENGIAALTKKYMEHKDRVPYSELKYKNPNTRKTDVVTDQNALKTDPEKIKYGASTVLSRRKQTVKVGGYTTEITDKNGKTKTVNRKSYDIPVTKLLDDASVYLNPNSNKVERDYVDFINELKAINKTATKMREETVLPKKDPKASLIYANEVESLMEKVRAAKANAPRERQAQLLATANVNKQIQQHNEAGDELDKDDLKKLRNNALRSARIETGAERKAVKITDEEWDAIQANAISSTNLGEIIKYMDDDELKARATPRKTQTLSNVRADRAKALANNGYTIADIAKQLGVSTSTISKYVSS